jgi:hypothetical protein
MYGTPSVNLPADPLLWAVPLCVVIGLVLLFLARRSLVQLLLLVAAGLGGIVTTLIAWSLEPAVLGVEPQGAIDNVFLPILGYEVTFTLGFVVAASAGLLLLGRWATAGGRQLP